MVSMGKNPFGFTIIEVMIVLASTGALLLIAFAIINGEVSSTSYQNSIRSLAIEMQNIANQTTSGQYAFSNSTSCDGSSLSLPVITNSGVSGQGTSTNCTFLGKLVVIGTDNKSLDIYPVAGIQCTNWSGGSSGGPSGECQSPDGLNNSNPVVDNLDPTSYQLGSGLEIRCIFFDIGHCSGDASTWASNICSFGFFYSNNPSNTSSEADLYPIDKCQQISSSQPNNYPCSYSDGSPTETNSSGNNCHLYSNSTNPTTDSSAISNSSVTPIGPAFLCNYYDFGGSNCRKSGYSAPNSYQSTPAINICVFNTNNSNQSEDIVINSSSNSGTTVQGSAFSVTLETNSSC
jgi:type II secretory pathway pseudopilin PulG